MASPSRPFEHTLVVGGTGMLREASIGLAMRSTRLTSVARTRASLGRLNDALPEGAVTHHCLRLDWTAPEDFIEGIVRHVASDPPELTVAWIHDGPLGLHLADALDRTMADRRHPGTRHTFLHLVGSATENPETMADELLGGIPDLRSTVYRQVVLGAKGAGRARRWLTAAEISRGVLAAVDSGETRVTVGSVEGL
jgi:hypothetical protein